MARHLLRWFLLSLAEDLATLVNQADLAGVYCPHHPPAGNGGPEDGIRFDTARFDYHGGISSGNYPDLSLKRQIICLDLK